MELLLNDQQTLLQAAAARLAVAKGGPRQARKLRDANREIDTDAWTDISAAGWLSALVAEQNDGLGLGIFDLALALEEVGKQVVMTPLTEAATAIWAITEVTGRPPSSIQDLVVPAINMPGQNHPAQVRPGHGAVEFDRKVSPLTGSIHFVAFAASADAFLVTTDAALCLLPRDTAGVSIVTLRQVDGSTSSAVTFAHTPVAASQVLARGDQAAAIAKKIQDLLILGTSAELLGTATAALDITVDYMKLREQFGKPIGSFQALAHRAVNCYVDIELNRSLLYNVLASWDAGTAHPAMISAVKARVGRSALDTVRAALQLHGAIGYTEEHDIGVYYKRAVALAAKYGNEIAHIGLFSDMTLSSN